MISTIIAGVICVVLLVLLAIGCWFFPVFDVQEKLNFVIYQDFLFVRIEEASARWKWLEQTPLASQTAELRSLGFVWGGDYDVQNSIREEFLAPESEEPDEVGFPDEVGSVEVPPLASPHSAPTRPKSNSEATQVAASHQHFVRLLVHPQQKCCAELMSICIRRGADIPLQIEPLQTNVSSLWSDGERDVSYNTTNCAPNFLAEASKRNEHLWTRRRGADVAELMALHLRRRAELAPQIELPLSSLDSSEWLRFQERDFARLRENWAQLSKRPRALVARRWAFPFSAQGRSNFEWLGQFASSSTPV